MNTIDIKSIIEANGLDTTEVARRLFPNNKYFKLAMNRVMAGHAELDAPQLATFATVVGCTIDDLFKQDFWKSSSSDGLHKFTNGDYTAVLDTKSWITKIFKNDSIVHESVLHSGDVPLSKYFNSLNKIVNENS